MVGIERADAEGRSTGPSSVEDRVSFLEDRLHAAEVRLRRSRSAGLVLLLSLLGVGLVGQGSSAHEVLDASLVRTKKLVILDEDGKASAWFGSQDGGAILTFVDKAGKVRLWVSSGGGGGPGQGLKSDAGMRVFDRAGRSRAHFGVTALDPEHEYPYMFLTGGKDSRVEAHVAVRDDVPGMRLVAKDGVVTFKAP